MNKIDTIIFDFGGVLVDWNPHYLYDFYFGDTKKTDYFLTDICTPEWNAQMDGGKPFADGIAEKIAEHPEYEKEIRMYWTDWKQMMGNQIDGMQELLQDLKTAGYHIYGLSNWSAETFYQIRPKYPVFDLLEGFVLSGDEKCLKPEPKIYTILLDRYHINPNTAVFFDDNLANVEGAKAVGIQGIQFVSAEEIRKKLGMTN